MDFKSENGLLTVFLAGRIDSSCAEERGKEIDAIMSANPHENMIFDAANLEYISSAGLRVILKVRKSEAGLRIINASSEVYDIFEMTGFTEMITVEKAFRTLCVDGCEVIGKGAKGTVYRYNADTIIKVYNNPDSLPDIKNERELARRAFVLGVPTAISYDIVKIGESYGSVFELLDAKSFSEMIVSEPENRDKYSAEFAKLLRLIHSTTVKESDMPDVKVIAERWLSECKKHLSPEDYDKLAKLIHDTPDTLNMIHGDYHTNNVMLQNGETLLIDMDTLSHGHPIFELANTFVTYVSFAETGASDIEKFLGMPCDTAKQVWDTFIKVYLDTEDKARIDDVEKKVRLLSYARIIRHTSRRATAGDEKSEKIIATCVKEVSELLKQVDTFEF